MSNLSFGIILILRSDSENYILNHKHLYLKIFMRPQNSYNNIMNYFVYELILPHTLDLLYRILYPKEQTGIIETVAIYWRLETGDCTVLQETTFQNAYISYMSKWIIYACNTNYINFDCRPIYI